MSDEWLHIVRFGRQAILPGEPDEPDIWAHGSKVRPFRWRWYLTAGPEGERLSDDRYALTSNGAETQAVFTALHAKFRGGVQ